ncbi:site-specific integrase [Microvirga massiliensis]|uniref:site-specific integrase n=1 Tax=Microvirga massiliensis TaxID=1033741 RepID=UPI00093AA589
MLKIARRRFGSDKNSRHDEARYFPSKAELALIIKHAKSFPHKAAYPLISCAIFTGLRQGELRALTWDDVNLHDPFPQIQVRRRADPWGRIGSPKTAASRRTVPIGPRLVQILKEWEPKCPSSDLRLMFPNGKGKVESTANIWNRIWEPIVRQSGLTNPDGTIRLRFHDLRHVAASLFMNKDRPQSESKPSWDTRAFR